MPEPGLIESEGRRVNLDRRAVWRGRVVTRDQQGRTSTTYENPRAVWCQRQETADSFDAIADQGFTVGLRDVQTGLWLFRFDPAFDALDRFVSDGGMWSCRAVERLDRRRWLRVSAEQIVTGVTAQNIADFSDLTRAAYP